MLNDLCTRLILSCSSLETKVNERSKPKLTEALERDLAASSSSQGWFYYFPIGDLLPLLSEKFQFFGIWKWKKSLQWQWINSFSHSPLEIEFCAFSFSFVLAVVDNRLVIYVAIFWMPEQFSSSNVDLNLQQFVSEIYLIKWTFGTLCLAIYRNDSGKLWKCFMLALMHNQLHRSIAEFIELAI